MEITKSTRHQKIIGNFSEISLHMQLGCLVQSFEVIVVDHTGIKTLSLIILQQDNDLASTVRSRTRNVGKERTSVNVFRSRKERPLDNIIGSLQSRSLASRG